VSGGASGGVRLRDKAVIVTGSTTGIGRAIAERCVAEGARVLVHGTKPAGWILGHLVVSGDFLRRQWQRPPLAPRDWGPRFGPGTRPPTDPALYPAMGALREALHAVYADLAAVAPAVPPELLDRANPFEGARRAFPSLREFAVYLMTAHLGYHLGELAGWRVAAGLTPRATRSSPGA
jgi:NAD(P)-dependent dehydrogenase (short-subunit alcohol dehydrogenase family)